VRSTNNAAHMTQFTKSSGLILCLVVSAALNVFAQENVWLVQYSQPPGIFPTQSNMYPPGANAQTLDLPPTSSGNGFCYWLTNGIPGAAASGQSLNAVVCQMTTNITAVAVYAPISQDTNQNGIPDFEELYYYGSTTNSPDGDTDADGFTFSQELVRGYDPAIPDVTSNGGAIVRLSLPVSLPPANLYCYQILSQPQAIIPAASGCVSPGTPVQTPDAAYGPTSGYYFAYWTVNGVRQAGVTGAALTQVTLPMTNDEVATAVFLPSGSSTGCVFPDWYLRFWFDSLACPTSTFDPTGDGFTLSDDMARDYSPVVANATTNGGSILRLSAGTTLNPPQIPPLPCPQCVVFSIENGQLQLAWGPGGILQSAPSMNGPWTDITEATDPYTITPTESQMFFRVRFP